MKKVAAGSEWPLIFSLGPKAALEREAPLFRLRPEDIGYHLVPH